jgi:hypothetical protein
VIIGVVLGPVPEVLIDGIITHREVNPGTEPGTATLVVTGRDVSVMLDLEEKSEKFENQPDFLIATRIILQYAQYGLVPMALPTTAIPIMLLRTPWQAETDLQFLKRLAARNGYVFYIEPLTFGVNTAYFGPENRAGVPQPALTTNMGPFTNVLRLDVSEDALAPVGASGSFVEPITRTSIPIPPMPPLRIPPLALTATPAKRRTLLRDTANQDPSQAATSAIAASTRSPDSVSANGEVDSVRYGSVLRARKLVGVRGAGFSFNGFYYVKKVTHNIQRGSYKQSFVLSREGTGALLPAVIP